MCTVIYYPSEKKKIFVSLRDENPARAKAISPSLIGYKSNHLLMPVDPKGTGTWAGINNSGTVIILLNGGFEKHQPGLSYSKSRGLIVKELLGEPLPVLSWLLMNLNTVEPFTLIVYSDGHLFQLVWDGQSKHKKILNPSIPHIFSSATLYDTASKQIRKERFNNWIKEEQTMDADSFKAFFSRYKDPSNGFLINRDNKIKTLSFSFIEYSTYAGAQYTYHDFIDNHAYESAIHFSYQQEAITSDTVC